MKFDPDKDCPKVDLIIDHDKTVETIRKRNELLGRNDDPEEWYRNSVARYIQEQKGICQIAESLEIPEDLDDWWFAWKGVDLDDFAAMYDFGVREVAKFFIQLLREETLSVARTTWFIKDYTDKANSPDIDQRSRDRYTKSVAEMEERLKTEAFRKMREAPVLCNPEYLKKAVIYTGQSLGMLTQTWRKAADDFESAINPSINYCLESAKDNVIVFGKEASIKLIEDETGKKVTEENYRNLWDDIGLMYVRIRHGETLEILYG